MKGKYCKNRIVIPDLIKKMKPQQREHQPQKENQCSNMYNNVHDHHDDKPARSQLDTQTRMKVSQYLDQREEQHSKDQIEVPTNQSTYRMYEPDPQSLNEESSIKSVMISEGKRHRGEISRLEELIKSERMFINPDRWNCFMERAMCDQNFHKALKGFLYGYFIQNYN